MTTKQSLLLGQIPVLISRTRGLQASIQKGTILFYHGLGATKETHLAEIESLAAAGFLVVAVDAVGHGQRSDPDLEQLVAFGNPARTVSFLNIIHKSAKELPLLLDELQSRQWIYRGRIGISGISMGGYICYLGITLDSRFKVASTLLGSPEWDSASTASPHLHIDMFSRIRLLSQNAGKDEIVDATKVQRFHARLRESYRDYNRRFEYMEYPYSGHFMEEEDWSRCTDRMVEWFNLHMSQD